MAPTPKQNRRPEGAPNSTGGQFAETRSATHKGALSNISAFPVEREPLDVEILGEPDPVEEFDTRVVAPTGTRYLRNGVLHRVGAPAYEGRDGTEEYYEDGVLNRTDGPAVIEYDGHQENWENGRLLSA